MEKEILTLEIIRNDAKRHFRGLFLGLLLFLPFYALLCFILVFFISLVLNIVIQDKMTLNIVVVILFLPFAAVYIYEIVKSMRGFVRFLKGELTITDDWLVEKLEERKGRYTRRPNTFVFARCGEFWVSDSYYYKWSKLCGMNGDSLFHSAKLDEDFYVASVGEVKNIMIYSKKLFELKR